MSFDESVFQKINRYTVPLLVLSVVSGIAAYAAAAGFAHDILFRINGWITIFAVLGLGQRYLNFRNNITDYFSKTSFAVYIFHAPWLVAAAYCALSVTDNVPAQILLILSASVTATFITCEIFKRIPVTRFLFGLKR